MPDNKRNYIEFNMVEPIGLSRSNCCTEKTHYDSNHSCEVQKGKNQIKKKKSKKPNENLPGTVGPDPRSVP